MEDWLMLDKLIIIFYICINSVPKDRIVYMVLFILLYIILNVGKAMLSSEKYKIIFLSLILIITMLSSIYYIDNFILLAPITVLEIVNHRYPKRILFLVLVISMFLVNSSIKSEYICFSLLNFMSFQFVANLEKRLVKYTSQNDELKEKNFSLVSKYNNQLQYKDQIIYTSQLEERNKIAQEIHDKLGHSISGSIMQLEAAKLIMDQNMDKSKFFIQNTIDILREGMDSIRVTLKNIKPNSEELGINKIKLLIDEYNINGKIKAELFFEKDLEIIGFLEWKIIFDNTKEILTNALKYSGAKNIKIHIKVLNTLIKLEIKDDGLGNNKIIKGLGLQGIEERTTNLNGKVIIDGSEGFSVITLLPISKRGC